MERDRAPTPEQQSADRPVAQREPAAGETSRVGFQAERPGNGSISRREKPGAPFRARVFTAYGQRESPLLLLGPRPPAPPRPPPKTQTDYPRLMIELIVTRARAGRTLSPASVARRSCLQFVDTINGADLNEIHGMCLMTRNAITFV